MKKLLVLAVGLAFAFGSTLAQKAKEENKLEKTKKAEVKAPEIGEKAPDFELPTATKDTIYEARKLSDFLGKGPVVLAFYPADWSGGCTKEVCTLRDAFAEFEKLGATIIGISGDYVYSHKEWAKHHNLPFFLASDHLGKTAAQYDSYMAEEGYCKRTVYVLDKNGAVRYKNLQFKARSEEDYQALQKAVAALK